MWFFDKKKAKVAGRAYRETRHPEGRRKGAPPMSWTFQGIAYQTKRDYYAAIALEWLSAGGLNDRRFVRETFARMSDDELADEAIDGFAGEQPPFERDGLTQAFAEYRHTVEASPVEADDDSNRTLW
jgi:hypothetical protein